MSQNHPCALSQTVYEMKKDDLVLSTFHCHDLYGTTPLIFSLSRSQTNTCHTEAKPVRTFLVWVRNALLPVLRCDPTDQEALCSCTTFPTVTAALNGRMSCLEFPWEALSEARHRCKVHWPPEKGQETRWLHSSH